jgi:hypothetical protein
LKEEAMAFINSDGSEAVSGGVGGYATKVTANFARSANTTAYAAGQVVTASGGGAITLAGCGRLNGGSGMITQVSLVDANNAATPLQPILYVFQGTAAPTSLADNAALALADADHDNQVLVVTLTETYLTNAGAAGAGRRLWIARGLSSAFVCGPAATSLYAYVSSGGAYTPLNAEAFRFNFSIVQN